MSTMPDSKDRRSPQVKALGRTIRRDISIPGLQIARQSGQLLTQQNNLANAVANGGSPNPVDHLIESIKINTDIEVSLKLLKLGFIGRVIDLTANVQALIIPRAKAKRGYIIINPAEITGFSSTITPFPSAARAAGVYTSSAFNVSGVDTARFFLDITANAGGGTLTVNAQTQDPLTLNWATSQSDIFGGSAAIGTYYASIGPLGVDRQLRLVATVGVAAITFSVSGLLKGGALTPNGSTVYIGPQGVNTVSGYPILPGQREYFFLDDDVEVFAISPTEPMTIKVFQLS